MAALLRLMPFDRENQTLDNGKIVTRFQGSGITPKGSSFIPLNSIRKLFGIFLAAA